MRRFLKVFSLVMILIITGCSKASHKENYEDQTPPQTEEPTNPVKPGDDTIDLSNQPALQNRKIIYTIDLSIVSTSPTETYNKIMDDLNSYEAYVESEEITTKIFKVTLRVKTEHLTNLVNAIQDDGETVSYKKTSEDVTNSYSTLSARLAALQTQQDRILELIETAENLHDIITLEETRAKIEAELNDIGLKLNNYDSLVEYSTVHLTISKVEDLNELLPETPVPSVSFDKSDKNSFSVTLYNPSEHSTTMTIIVTHNGKTVNELTKDVYRDSSEVIEIEDLKPGQTYRVEVTSQVDKHRSSKTQMIEVSTSSTFLSKTSNVFTSSLKALVKFFEFIALAIIAILPFAVAFTIIIGIPLGIYYKVKKKRTVDNESKQPNDKNLK
jgi:Domain of unknown function (DUF4349)